MKRNRREEIVKLITENRMVKATDLAKEYRVSMETIRRDLEYLEEKGYLSRVYGGAVMKAMHGLEPDYCSREIKNYEQKLAISQAAMEQVKDGDTIIIDIGTTTQEFAKLLKGRKKITVITNSVRAGLSLISDYNIRVILLGGNLRNGDDSTSGYWAEEMIDQFYVDKLFLGVGGFTIESGITDYHIEESNLRRHFIRSAHKVIALADYSKFGVRAMNFVCSAKDISLFITDKKADKKIINDFRNFYGEVIVAEELEKTKNLCSFFDGHGEGID